MRKLVYCYVNKHVRPGQVVHTGNVSEFSNTPLPERSTTWGVNEPIIIIHETEHGDYSGGSVQASNYRVLMRNEEIGPHLIELYGSHGYKALAYEAYLGPIPLCDELMVALESLDKYPLLDEDDHSDLESELESEAWSDHGCSDFRRALRRLAKDTVAADYCDDLQSLIDDASGGELHMLRAEFGEQFYNGEPFVVETGCSVHFFINEWMSGARSCQANSVEVFKRLREITKGES